VLACLSLQLCECAFVLKKWLEMRLQQLLLPTFKGEQ